MKIIGLDQQEYSWIPSNNIVDTEKRSGLHNKAKELLKERYPNDRILEELVLPGTKTATRKSTLKADFFIPVRKLINLQKWYFLPNYNFELIELFHNESIEEWRSKIWRN